MRDLPDSIVVAGQGRWCGELAEGLLTYSGLRVGSVPLDRAVAALKPRAWRTIARADLLVLVGFRPGARTIRGLAFDAALAVVHKIAPRQIIVRYWIGTDVQRTLDDLENHTLSRRRFERAIRRAEHLAGSASLAEELAEVGITAEVVDFPSLGVRPDATPLPLPDRFTVLSYVPDFRSDFYGGPDLVRAAKALPEVQFNIVGGVGTWLEETPPNVRFLGWQDDMRPRYAECSCVVRLVEHDSIGGTIVEALSYGRAAIYSCRLEHTTYVPFGDAAALIAKLRTMVERYAGVLTPPDAEASDWAMSHFGPERLFGDLAERLVAIRDRRNREHPA